MVICSLESGSHSGDELFYRGLSMHLRQKPLSDQTEQCHPPLRVLTQVIQMPYAAVALPFTRADKNCADCLFQNLLGWSRVYIDLLIVEKSDLQV